MCQFLLICDKFYCHCNYPEEKGQADMGKQGQKKDIRRGGCPFRQLEL